jgi:hypothetical protein
MTLELSVLMENLCWRYFAILAAILARVYPRDEPDIGCLVNSPPPYRISPKIMSANLGKYKLMEPTQLYCCFQ